MDRNLTAHEPHSPLPCLCSRCLMSAPPLASVDGLTFHRVEAHGEGRVLHAWVPDELKDVGVQTALERRLSLRFKSRWAVAPPAPSTGIFSRLRSFLGL